MQVVNNFVLSARENSLTNIERIDLQDYHASSVCMHYIRLLLFRERKCSFSSFALTRLPVSNSLDLLPLSQSFLFPFLFQYLIPNLEISTRSELGFRPYPSSIPIEYKRQRSEEESDTPEEGGAPLDAEVVEHLVREERESCACC
jgi:hypothetical protein